MHRTNCVPRPGVWCLMLALGVGCLLYPGKVQAQQPPPPAGMIVPINVTKELQTPSGKRIKNHSVEKPGIVDISYTGDLKTMLITGRQPGSTVLTLTDQDDQTTQVQLLVQADVEFLRQALRLAVPNANIEPVPVGKDTFLLTGFVAKAEDIPAVLGAAQALAPKVVNALRVGGVMQVQLDVLIARVQRSRLRSWDFSFFNSGDVHFLANVLSPGAATAANLINVSSVNSRVAGSSNLLLGFVNDTQGFFAFIQALNQEGLAKIVACPKLVTMSGKPATFLSGGQLAIPEPSGLGTNAVRYQPFGTELSFLPIVLGNGKIYLEVAPSINIRNDANGTEIQGTKVPGFDTQSLHASIELEAGQTLAIGGLIQHEVNAVTSKVPVLGDIPFISPLFSSKGYDHRESELVILVTPHLVDPMSCNQLPKYVPGQETRIPDDFEFFIEGILEAPRGQREIFPGGNYRPAYLNGPSGSVFPCGVNTDGRGCGLGGCRNGACGTGGCATGNCGGVSSVPASTPATSQPPVVNTPTNLPASYYTEPAPAGQTEVILPANSGTTGTGAYYERGATSVPPVPASPAGIGSAFGGSGN